MIDWIYYLVLVWHAALILPLLLYVLRAEDIADRVLAFDGLATVFVSAFAVLGLHRQEPFYFDIALVVAMIGFVQTVAAARLLEYRGDIE